MTNPQPPSTSGSSVTISDEIRAKFPDVCDLILKSESMNDEERQYWINILPVMTPEQVEDLRGILTNERAQLSAIDAKYSKEIDKVGGAEITRQTEEERNRRRAERSQQEAAHAADEQRNAETVLKEIEGG